jgi:uncharacterized protein (TIRG00374 family)
MRPRRWAAILLRLAVGVGALAYLVLRLDLGLAWRTLAAAGGVWLGAAACAQLVAKVFWLLRWNTLLRAAGHGRSLGHLLRLVLEGLFFNNFLPSSVGGDVARGLGLAAGGVPRATAAASVVLDRLVGVLALAAMAVVGGILGGLLWPHDGPWAIAAAFALAAGAIVAVLTRPRVLDRLASLRGVPDVLAARLRRVLGAMSLVSGRGGAVRTAVGYSLGLSASSAVFHWSVGRALDMQVPLLAFFVIVPTVMLAAALPITLNGLGIRELGFVTFLGARGIAPETAAVFAFLVFLLPLAFALVGGVLFAGGDRRAGSREEVS